MTLMIEMPFTKEKLKMKAPEVKETQIKIESTEENDLKESLLSET